MDTDKHGIIMLYILLYAFKICLHCNTLFGILLQKDLMDIW